MRLDDELRFGLFPPLGFKRMLVQLTPHDTPLIVE